MRPEIYCNLYIVLFYVRVVIKPFVVVVIVAEVQT